MGNRPVLLLVDGHERRRDIREALEAAAYVVHESFDYFGAIHMFNLYQPALVVIDFKFDGKFGLFTALWLSVNTEEPFPTHYVMLTPCDEIEKPGMIRTARSQGVQMIPRESGYVEKILELAQA